jgi:type II secretory pathway component PulF
LELNPACDKIREMPQFSYRARNAQGGLVEGVLDCSDRSVAIRQIEQLHYIPIRIESIGGESKNGAREAATATSGSSLTQALKVPHSQLLVFTEQLAHLLRAGMTLDEGLSILERRLKQPRVQQMTKALHQALVDGRSFSQALREFPRVFPPLYVNMVAAGEASGALPDILHRLVKHLMQAKDLRDRVQQALIYPAFLAFAGVVLITIFITFMVPQLTQFMSANGGALPMPTRILLEANHLITGYWWLAILVGIGIAVGFRAFVRNEEGRIAWDRFRLRVPGYGRIIRHRYYAQFSRTLGTLMENGIPLLRALELVSEIAGNRYLEVKLIEVRRSVIDGATLSTALAAHDLFPELFTDMMAVGEQTGHFAETMKTIADVYERELEKSVSIVSQLIPPVIIFLIAILVGFVVYSILSAVFEMTHSLQVRPH